ITAVSWRLGHFAPQLRLEELAEGHKQKAEFAAAALATTAVALELMHTGAEWTSKKYGAATATGRYH
ncbi:hypothetical protein HX776_11310, partial [Pseudomonas agarici]|uniref:hypothetical protein n=1 Tax=Pseudomonas agarici TaxID=46677 RepID=UPI0015A031A5